MKNSNVRIPAFCVHVALLVYALSTCACEEAPFCEPADDYPVREIYIDSECLPDDRATILGAVDSINALAERTICAPLVEVVGEIEVRKDTIHPHTRVDVVTCHYTEPDWYADSKYEHWLGCASAHEYITVIRLFLFRVPSPNWRRALVLHELGHYVGIKSHADDLNAVMCGSVNPLSTAYTATDIDMFCGVYDCG